MNIEQAIATIKEYLDMDSNVSNEFIDSIKALVDVAEKYQKIQAIVSDFREYQKGISYGFGGATYMQMVSEVVEDGKDN